MLVSTFYLYVLIDFVINAVVFRKSLKIPQG
jgi:hypothetical protein